MSPAAMPKILLRVFVVANMALIAIGAYSVNFTLANPAHPQLSIDSR